MKNKAGRIFDGRSFRGLVSKSSVLSHAFFREIKVAESGRAKALIREFARADYLVAKGFAQFLAYLISLVDKPTVRMLLVGNLWDEHGSGDAHEIHFELYKNLLSSIGVQEPNPPSDARADFLQLHYEIAGENVLNGIAVFTYANEFLSMYEFSQVRAACKLHFVDVDERYFLTNQKADVIHTKQLEKALEDLVETDDQVAELTRAVEMALDSRSRFYDSVVANSN